MYYCMVYNGMYIFVGWGEVVYMWVNSMGRIGFCYLETFRWHLEVIKLDDVIKETLSRDFHSGSFGDRELRWWKLVEVIEWECVRIFRFCFVYHIYCVLCGFWHPWKWTYTNATDSVELNMYNRNEGDKTSYFSAQPEGILFIRSHGLLDLICRYFWVGLW